MTTAEAPAPQRAFDRRFVNVVAAGLFYFFGLGILAPVLPRYVEDVLDGGGTQVGIAVGAFALTAALLRPWAGGIGDRRGRRVLVVGGTAAAGLAILGYGLPGGLAVLVLFRLLTGAGEAAAFIGAATTAQDLAPPGRRGQAASLFSISVYSGISFGPAVGDWLYNHRGPGWAWTVAAGCCFIAAVLGSFLPSRVGETAAPAPAVAVVPPPGARTGSRRWIHPAARGPGLVLALGASGYAGFSAFVPLYIDDIGVADAGPVFFEYGALILAVRVLASRLPDVLGTRRGPFVALTFQCTGLLVMGLWASAAGLYVGTAIYAIGVSMLYPALFPAVVDGAPEAERSQAIGTFTMFFDLAQGLGAPLLGIVVSLTSEPGAFLAAAALSGCGLVLHQRTTRTVTGPIDEPCPPPEPGE